MILMNSILTIFKKEFYRVMSDKRLIFTSIILPGLAIYLMYSFLGSVIQREIEDVDTHNMIVYESNMTDDFKNLLVTLYGEPEFITITDESHEFLEEQVLIGEIDLLVYFDETFQTQIDDFEIDGSIIPNVDMYYNPFEDYSRDAYYDTLNALYTYENSIGFDRFGDDYHPFTINAGFTEPGENEIYNEEKASGEMFAGLLPMLIVMFLFSGAMSIGPDSIAGEKERGTIATLLVTPTKRRDIAVGKVLSLSVISLFSATSSFIGIMLSLPKLMQQNDLSISIYSIGDFIILFTVLLATVFFIVGIISVISAYAKSIKEASLLIMPVYFASVVVGMSTMMSGEATTNPALFMIPIYNSVHMIISILTFEVSIVNFIIMVSSNLVYASILIFVLNKFFQSEKIMFSK